MPTYAIGDIQGCYKQLKKLLKHIDFKPGTDKLWFAGDLVNRGPRSLDTLRFIRDLGDDAVSVLGNHDLHVLAVTRGYSTEKRRDRIGKLLKAPDLDELMDWLQQQPLLHHDKQSGMTMIHAGLPPQWNLKLARSCAREVEDTLRSSKASDFFANMYGDEPDTWDDSLSGHERLRFITNCLTRLRYCSKKGQLCLQAKGAPGNQPRPFKPWFKIKKRASKDMKIIFGHWSTLGKTDEPGVYPLDTGCLWGGKLTALRIDDMKYFRIKCPDGLHM